MQYVAVIYNDTIGTYTVLHTALQEENMVVQYLTKHLHHQFSEIL